MKQTKIERCTLIKLISKYCRNNWLRLIWLSKKVTFLPDTHGQLYVAMSRVGSPAKLKVAAMNYYVKNIVFRDVLI